MDSAGNVVIADSGRAVRVVADRNGVFYGRRMRASDIYTVAGSF